MKKKRRTTEKRVIPLTGVLLALFLLPLVSGCSRGSLFRADDYYLIHGSEPQETEEVPETEEETHKASSEPAAASEPAEKPEEQQKPEEEELAPEAEALRNIMQTVWVAYWDGHISEALDTYGGVIENICMFAASYDPDGHVFIPEDLQNQLAMIREKDTDGAWNYYLSVTNDIVASGWSSAKDVDLLHHLLEKPEDARKHAEELAVLAAEGGYDGLEIDFESLHGDLELWSSFLIFEEALIEETQERSLALRIVLEPATPQEGLTFPEGPEYVMMCYDLHGFGTEPGAKADKDFLIGLVEDFAFIPGLEFALANGGFDWNVETGYVTTLSDQNVRQLVERFEFEHQRGDTSGAVFGVYEGDDGQQHTMWYADAETLQLWYSYLCDAAGREVRCSLWKL